MNPWFKVLKYKFTNMSKNTFLKRLILLKFVLNIFLLRWIDGRQPEPDADFIQLVVKRKARHHAARVQLNQRVDAGIVLNRAFQALGEGLVKFAEFLEQRHELGQIRRDAAEITAQQVRAGQAKHHFVFRRKR